MATTATANLSLTYSPPSGPANSATATFSAAATSNAQNVGVIDIPAATAPSTVFAIPFGSVASAKVLMIINKTNDEIGIRLNGLPADIFRISAGGFFAVNMPTDPAADPISSASITIINATVSLQSVNFFVFGD